ncbi:MAG: sigma-70 family RNA polymerase sigma factor [Eubacteriales bacterium]
MKLDEDFRNVIILRELNDQTYEEIARQLALSEGTVKSRLFRARSKLKELLE